MSLAITFSRARVGMDAPIVTVEVHLSNGLPGFTIVGLPDASVKESKERVRSAIINSGFEFPSKRITVNLAPADLPKDGGRFDLPIAIGILAASEQIDQTPLKALEFIGELALSGELRPIKGSLTASIAAKHAHRALFVPTPNANEATLPSAVTVFAVCHLLQVCAHIQKKTLIDPCVTSVEGIKPPHAPDMEDVRGQQQAKRALEVAAAGKHNLLMIGPPGAGKSMLAARLPGILPLMTEQERLEVAAIQSIALSNDTLDWNIRPIRTPHHTASGIALAGGGSNPKPGEISLAHNGVLFLDELPEYGRKALEVLREPLETGEIAISRAACQVKYPANFQLITAMNPCPCGTPEKPSDKCNNPIACCNRYQSKLSGPLLDRIDIHLKVDAVPLSQLNQRHTSEENSNDIRARVESARSRQLDRCGKSNHDMDSKEVSQYCQLSNEHQHFIEQAAEHLGLSARAYHRVLKVSKTLADLDACEQIEKHHLTEALSYRSIF
ncbi:ATP-dependent protease [Gammaproteobacteria bacterium 45_16_T64]|nr:ATP-dependent protease [Gammaproteobacteria bacterium 45_16_T64]